MDCVLDLIKNCHGVNGKAAHEEPVGDDGRQETEKQSSIWDTGVKAHNCKVEEKDFHTYFMTGPFFLMLIETDSSIIFSNQFKFVRWDRDGI